MSFHPEFPEKDEVEIILAGYGAQAKYSIETFQQYRNTNVSMILDLENSSVEGQKYGIPLRNYKDKKKELFKDPSLKWMICYRKNEVKREVHHELRSHDADLINAIHPDATIATSASIGGANIINANATIQPYATIGDGCMIHAGAIIEHDCEIGSFVNLAPGATLAGHVNVENEAYIFTQASVIPNRTISNNAVVGAGSVVLEDVEPNTKVAGVPARELDH